MPNHTTLPLVPAMPLKISGTANHHPAEHDQRKYCLTKTIYAVGIDPTTNPKEKIAQFHDVHPDVVTAAAELESYLADPEFRHSLWFLRFFSRVRRIMSMINFGANEYVKTRMTEEFIDELINDGYIRCLRSMAVPSGQAYVAFAKSYAATHNMPFAASLLFNPSGGARMALRHFLTAERSHGQHRPVTPADGMSHTAQNQWLVAGKTINWPIVAYDGSEGPLDMAESQGKLPDGVKDTLSELWRRNPSLREYSGTNRLSGDIPFQIVEDAVDIILHSSSVPAAIKTRYDQIVEVANLQGIDPFYAVYKQLFSRKDQLRPYWDRARTMLYEYSLMLWEDQNKEWLTNGSRSAAGGVTYRPRKDSTRKPLKQSLPGTIYLNNGRYYWVVRNKMKLVALVDDHNKRALPGTIGNCQGRYFWVVPGVLKRQRLVAKGEKFSTTDRATAEKIALQLWKMLQSKKPKLAAKIKARRAWGTATKDRSVAERIAHTMWKHIQQRDPALAARILTDDRPDPQDHWIAQICIGGKHRHIGSFKTREEAMAAYVKEFERIFGYPPGYNVQSIPKLDKVWPTWEEQKMQLEARTEPEPVLPVIGLTDLAMPLASVIDRMRKVDWITKYCMVILDNSVPGANQEMAVESRGQKWFGEIKQQGKRTVIYGCTAFDKDNQRIRITIFRPGFDRAEALAEEVYHLVYRIIGQTNPVLSAKIEQWYAKRINAGADTTLSGDEAFALAMTEEDVSADRTDLPRCIVHAAKKMFSDKYRVQDSVLESMAAV